MRLIAVLSILAVSALSGCQSKTSAPTVTVFAAASTTDALDEINRAFEKKTGVKVTANYAASSTLAQQISSGADADVFVSANVEWVDYLEDEKLIARRQNLLENRLVAIVPAGNRNELSSLHDLLRDEVRHVAVADVDAAPAGIYAKTALENLKLWKELEAKTVAAADVRQALTYVSTGAAEAGIVYATDAASTSEVEVFAEIPDEATPSIRYPIALIEKSGISPNAEAYYKYLASDEAAEVFRRHGFIVPEK